MILEFRNLRELRSLRCNRFCRSGKADSSAHSECLPFFNIDRKAPCGNQSCEESNESIISFSAWSGLRRMRKRATKQVAREVFVAPCLCLSSNLKSSGHFTVGVKC